MPRFSFAAYWLTQFACAAFLVCSPSTAAIEYFVSNTGRDSNTGTADRPFATIEAARDAVRAYIAGGMKEDLIIHIAAGNYFIEKPIEFDDRDGGRERHTVTYKGAPKLGTRIYGGRRLTGWKKLNDQQVGLTVPDLHEHFTLYENEKAANGGIFHVFKNAPAGDWKKEGTRLIYHPRKQPIEEQLMVLGTTKDVFFIKGRSMDQIVRNIVFDGLYMIGSDFAPEWKKGDSYSTTWDGEYDGKPWGGKTLCDSVIAPDMRHGQFYIENAQDIVIQNSKIYGAGFMAVMLNRWAQNCRVENCWIENAGCNGLFFMGWECGRGPFKTVAESYVNKKHVIRNNVFYDIGRFSNYGAGMYFNFSGDNLVEHNVFHGITHYAITLKGWRPMLINHFYKYAMIPDAERDPKREKIFDAHDVTFYDGYVVTEANQGAELLHSRNTTIRYNDISQIARFGDDMGMISMWGAGTGNVWEFNACHDGVNASGWDHWLHVLFNDDGSHQATVRGNIIYWIAGGGRSRAIMSKGNHQLNQYNIIADCELSAAATIGPFVEAAHDMVWSNNIVAAQIQDLTDGGHGTQKANGQVRPILKAAEKNLYFYQPLDRNQKTARQAENIQRRVEDRKKAVGIDADSIYADPLFDRKRPWWDAKYSDYLLKPDSPALRLGFVQTEMEKVGLQADFPFKLEEILGQPASKTRLAADFSRIFKNRITNQQVRSRDGSPLYKNSWVRYDGVEFGDGDYKQFRAQLEWKSPGLTFETVSNGRVVNALEYRDAFTTIPYWEVSEVFTQAGKTGPELINVEFAPEKDLASAKWKTVTEELVSRATVRHPLGVVNCDVVNGENHANGAAYMRANVYFRTGRDSELEIRGAHGVKVWVNSVCVFSQTGNLANSPRAKFRVKQGWNEYLVKVVQDDNPWKPHLNSYGNFWASLSTYYPAEGAFIVPGAQGQKVSIQPDKGTAIEIRADAPDGDLLGTLPFGQPTCPIKKTIGRKNIVLLFPNENIQVLDWLRFE